jgi:iron complex transport system substrate-binding protein
LRPVRGALASLLLLALAGCGGEERAAVSSSKDPATPTVGCQRVIALAPNLSETLFALGLGGRVVGVGDYSTFPPEVKELPKLGGLFNPNLEKIVSLKPDLAVLVPSEGDLAQKLKGLGVDSITLSNETLGDIEKSFHRLAERCGVPEAGDRLAAEFREGLKPDPLPGKPKVLLSAGRPVGRLADLVVAGPGTYFEELLARLGAVNAFADAPVRYPEIGMEDVIARAPDVIVEVRAEPVSPEVERQLISDWNALPNIPAVRNRRIVVIDGDYAVVPGPRIPQLYQQMRAALAGGGSR